MFKYYKIIAVFVLLFSVKMLYSEVVINECKISNFYYLPFDISPSVKDSNMKMILKKMSVKLFIEGYSNLSKEERPVNFVNNYWKIRKGLKKNNISYKNISIKNPGIFRNISGIDAVLYVKVVNLIIVKRESYAKIKVFFKIFDKTGKFIYKKRVIVEFNPDEYVENYLKYKDDEKVEKNEIPLKNIIIIPLLSRAFEEFYNWLNDISVE